jgi:hypothetical protein
MTSANLTYNQSMIGTLGAIDVAMHDQMERN